VGTPLRLLEKHSRWSWLRECQECQSCHQGKWWLLWSISNIKYILICLTLLVTTGFHMCYFIVLLSSLLFYNVENSTSKEKPLNVSKLLTDTVYWNKVRTSPYTANWIVLPSVHFSVTLLVLIQGLNGLSKSEINTQWCAKNPSVGVNKCWVWQCDCVSFTLLRVKHSIKTMALILIFLSMLYCRWIFLYMCFYMFIYRLIHLMQYKDKTIQKINTLFQSVTYMYCIHYWNGCSSLNGLASLLYQCS
jgi:hypothetical protein